MEMHEHVATTTYNWVVARYTGADLELALDSARTAIGVIYGEAGLRAWDAVSTPTDCGCDDYCIHTGPTQPLTPETRAELDAWLTDSYRTEED